MSKTEQQTLPSERIVSIDALRGFDMFWIIGGGTALGSLVHVWENPVTEAIHKQLEYVEWQGFRFEDLIFPLFLFIMEWCCRFRFPAVESGGKACLYSTCIF